MYMTQTEASGAQTRLRKFDVLSAATDAEARGRAESGAATGADTSDAGAAPATACGIAAFLSSRYNMPTTSLIISCVSYDTSGPLEGFDREGSASKPCTQSGTLAAALAAQLVPGWRALTCAPFWRWQLQVRGVVCACALSCCMHTGTGTYAPPSPPSEHALCPFALCKCTPHPALAAHPSLAQSLLESPCLGVPGICRYTAARAAWMARQVQLCIDADNCK